MIVLDTSLLIDSLTGPKHSGPVLLRVLASGERLILPSQVVYEWLRGPRTPQELTVRERLFPAEFTIPFGEEEAAIAAMLYRTLRRPRGREADLAIAACAIRQDAPLWTLNPADFRDIPGLVLFS
ncbi:MAG TPA: type II toxin-antitoxin system VapC family toxin [Bryobacteraceae bacterium]|nr:type II toxin-antitoxin system VapC family toxin [Bryobacteraceae bacterium]